MKAQHILSIAALLFLTACQQAETPPARILWEHPLSLSGKLLPKRRLNSHHATIFMPRSGLAPISAV